MLNRVFNVVFNYSLGVFTAVSELCRRRHKTKSLSRSQSLFNTIRFNLSRLSLGVLIGCGLISEPTWAAGVILQNGKLYYCPENVTSTSTCSSTQLTPLAAYVGVNSTGGTNISGEGATGEGAIAIGYNDSAPRVNSIAIGRYVVV
ncbi:ESPR-type extended signal peptide-containing protein, partial [Gallibacterium sp. AGMB14963]|uniref:ESPR-type extended signal peptide-containing protein n=1 Tax=Gallibacterium faecale TaxID=3019086 RepID=UPI0022F17EDF